MRETLAGPGRVGAGIFERNPGHGTVVPALWIVPILPVSKKVGAIAGNVVRGVEKLFELRVGHRIFINEEGLDLHGVLMEPAWKILPWILHVYAGGGASFDLCASHFKDKVAPRNANHARRWIGSGFC